MNESSVDLVMKGIDRWVADHPWATAGWVSPKAVTRDYEEILNGASGTIRDDRGTIHPIQQCHAEIHGLVSEIVNRGLQNGTVLEIGLGICGGTHQLWRSLFSRVVSIEYYRERIDNYVSLNDPNPKQSLFLYGSSTDPLTIFQANHLAEGCDVLFIDGDHTGPGVGQDYYNYKDLVKSGGLIVFHDTILDAPPKIQVRGFLDSLGLPWTPIHHSKCLGIGYMVNE